MFVLSVSRHTPRLTDALRQVGMWREREKEREREKGGKKAGGWERGKKDGSIRMGQGGVDTGAGKKDRNSRGVKERVELKLMMKEGGRWR